MKYFLDLSLALLILATVITCWRRGFIRSVLGAAKTLVAAIVAYLFGSAASAWLESRYLLSHVTGVIYDRLLDTLGQGDGHFDLSAVLNNLPDWLKTLLGVFRVDVSGIEDAYGSVTDGSAETLREMAESIGQPVAHVLSDVAAYAVLFFGTILVLTLLSFLLGKIADLPVIRTCDRFLGFFLGVLGAILYASAYTLLLYLVLSFVQTSYEQLGFSQAFEQTILFRWVWEHNIFRLILPIG